MLPGQCGGTRKQACDRCTSVLGQVPYYNKAVNCIYAGLWSGILDASVVLLVMQVTIDRQEDPAAYSVFMTNVSAGRKATAVVGGAHEATPDHAVLAQPETAGRALHNFPRDGVGRGPDVAAPAAAGATVGCPAQIFQRLQGCCAGRHCG